MASGLDTMRTFVAVNLSISTLRSIAEVQGELRSELKESEARIRWVPLANMHQTIKFLGDVDVELTEGIAAALRKVAADIAPFRVEAVGLGAFPNPSKPRVIWVGIKDSGEGLQRLNKATEAALEELGFPKEKRPFRTHVTLGRVKRGQCDLGEQVARLAERSFGVTTVEEVVLYESKLHRSGAEYVAHARVPLSGVPEQVAEPEPKAGDRPARAASPAAKPAAPAAPAASAAPAAPAASAAPAAPAAPAGGAPEQPAPDPGPEDSTGPTLKSESNEQAITEEKKNEE